MLKRLLKATAVTSLLLGYASHALAQGTAPTPTPGGTAVVVVATELQTLNPAITSGSGEGVVGCMMHEGLVEIDGEGNPVPDLGLLLDDL